MKTVKQLLLVFAFFAICFRSYATGISGTPLIIEKLRYQQLVDKVYEMKGEQYIWFGKDAAISLRYKVKALLDSSIYQGLDKSRYHYNWIATNVEETSLLDDSIMRSAIDRIFTDAMITYCKDMYGTSDLNDWLGYEDLKPYFESADNSFITTGLSIITSPVELDWFVRLLEPVTDEYLLMKTELREEIMLQSDSCTIKQLCQALHVLRWIKHYRFSNIDVRKVPEEIQMQYSWLW